MQPRGLEAVQPALRVGAAEVKHPSKFRGENRFWGERWVEVKGQFK